MAQETVPKLDPTIAQRNLAALREVDHRLAAQIEAWADSGPSDPIVSQTRDKRISFRLPQPDGSTMWFGRTSIPTVRAAALLERFDSGSANVLLPGIAEGTETAWLLQRLGLHRAVFVWEPDIHNVALGLRLHNLATAIRDRRLVLLVCQVAELADALCAWLKKNPGHLCPNQMMMYPWQSMQDIAAIRAAVEQAYARTEQNRQKALAEIQTGWQRMPKTAGSDSGARAGLLAIVALHAQDEVWSIADALAQAAQELGQPAVRVDIRSPGDMHSLARASRLADAADGPPTLSILIDVVREQVADILPASIPTIAWLGHRAEPPRSSLQGVRCVTSPVLLGSAAQLGLDTSRITVCPPPCLATVGPTELRADRPLEVAVLTDSPPIDPASIAPKLPSYAQIWRLAAELLAVRIEDFTSDQAAAVLDRAEAKLQASIEDAALRKEMIRNLGMVLGPSLAVRFVAQVLRENQISFRLHGPGWGTLFPEHAGASLTTIRHKAELFQSVKVAVHCDSTGLLSGDALLAAGCGAAVLARRHPSDQDAGGLHTLLKPGEELEVFLHARELVPLIKRLTVDESHRLYLARNAILRCVTDHTPIARLKMLETAATSVF